ncbi:hypothetical protein FVER53590_01978 [Fusarium verticillioides]|nr:hypothetical protein FVER53590_01978 [Fusarium verticillioides]
MSNRRIVVSIDFGTTYSGVAWADTTRPDVQHVLTEWPSAGSSKSSPKVPTELRRVANGWQWGFQIPESAKRIRYFKLKLDDPAQITKEGESAKDLTKVYLSCLHEHFVSLLEKRLSPSVVKSTPMDFVVTVPAIWSPKAKQSTEQAAAMAGFCGNQRIQLISEPEAAALYTLKTLSPSTLQVGRKFVVCDAGGGTVDLISYQVTKIGRVEVKEVTEGTGGKCGSSMLNMRFRRHLKQTHGDKYWTDERLVIALSEFESFKKTFSPKGEPLTLKVDPSLGLRRNRYTMTQDDMKTKIFEPIMKDVVCLIKEQIKMAGDGVAAVIMVGGFGQSRYLKSRVRDAISSRTDVLQPESGWTAVVKGAAMHGLSRYQPAGTRVEVASRIARRSYGTCLMTKYDMMKHNPREAFWSEKEQETVVSEMCWFIQKGESYPEGKPSRIEYQCDLPVMLGHVPQTEIDIYSNNNDGKAPVHLDETTQHIGTLSLDLRKIPEAVKRTAKIRRMGWHRYYCLKGAIEAVYGSAEITYTVKLGGITHDMISDANLDHSSLKQQDTAAPNDAACIMAANLHLRAAVPDHGQPAGKVVAGPPPSTLAAQLVENISASTKSSKSDENSELKGFFAIIQRVKDDPTLLKTPEDRVEHNHMLIYVYSRAVLEGIRLDDPFLDRTQVRTEGLKAISFLRFSIKETPAVLKHRVGEQEYMFRGREPLWVWLLPQLLRLLGHSQCLELTEAIEGFLQYTMLIIAQNWILWDMAPSFLFYLRTITSHILQQLQDPLLIPSVEESFKTLSLPPQIALSQFVEKESPFTSQLTYSVHQMSQALHQLISFCKVVAYPLTASDDAFDNVTSFSESVVWLIDVLGDMRVIQTRYGSNFPASSLYVLQLAQEIERALLRRKGISASVHKKAITLMSLNSSVRELRVAAGRVLATFSLARPEPILSSMVLPARPAEANGIGNPRVNQAQATFTDGNFRTNVSNGSSLMKTQDLISRNRKNSIAFLKSISDKNQPNLIETFIMAWGQLGTVVWEHELNLVLIKLLDYLGSNNNIVSACAFNELLNLADARRVTPRRLFEPFWPSLAYMTTKDMVQRPQMSRTIAELLQVSVNELLLLIQTHALPWLVLDKQKDVIQKIAEARQESEVWLPLIDPANLAATLALLLVQDTDDIASFAKSRLEELSTHFQTEPLVNLLQVEPVLTVIELLKAAGDADETKKAPVRKALDTMAKMMIPANKETRAKKSDHTARFIHSQLLGLMACLFDVINDQSLPDPERRRYIRAMEEMIRVSRGYASTARPQMSACLLSTLAQDALREASFSCWASMLTHLEETDVEALLETTFFVVTRYWPFMNESTALLAQQMLKSLVDEFDHLVAKYIVKLPSLRHIPELRDIETKMDQHRPATLAVEEVLEAFAERICHENSGVALQALTELIPYLQENQAALHASDMSLQSDIGVVALMRSLLDCASKYSGFPGDIARLCTEAMGLIGCLDPSKIETVREQRSIVILNNFATNEETTDFVLFLLEEALVPAFLSTTDVKFQGFLSFAMQELMARCDIKAACAMENSGMKGGNDIYRKWVAMPETVREVVAPFLASRYVVAPMPHTEIEYPLFRPGRPYPSWLRVYVLDLLRKGQTPFADLIFEPLARVIRVKDLSIAEFILPYIVLHTLLGSRTTQQERDDILGELLAILQYQPAETASYQEKEDMRRYCHLVFRVVDYAMRWMQTRRAAGRLTETDRERLAQVQEALDLIPAELIAQRAVDCNEYARALFHLEQHAHKMEQRKKEPGERTRLLQKLQDIYANVDEPDGLDGISAHLQVLDINQQILSHRKAGRWTAVQNWYEMQLAENPDNTDIQIELLHCLKQAGQHEGLLNHIEGMHTDASTDNKIMPYAVEAAWVTGRWESLTKFAQRFRGDPIEDFNISIATLFEKLRAKDKPKELIKIMKDIRVKISSSMNAASTSSLQACHDLLLKSHVLTDVEIIIGTKAGDEVARQTTAALLERRLEIIGAYMNDKQYLLGIRRATMELTRPTFTDLDISGLWLSSARLARKSNSLHQSFNAILHASKLGDDAATIENAKLLWREDQHRKAIQVLQGAIKSNKFMTQTGTANSTSSSKLSPQQKLLTARAQLLLAKWLDSAGQTHAGALREKYQQPPKTFSTWEKGHYYLGRHYKKILEAEKPLKADDQSDNYITGEVARLVIENYVRSLNSGTKYLYQTLPRILTLWLDLGAQVDKAPEGKASLSRELHRRRVEQLNLLHSFLDKYIHRLPAYIFYTALPQIVARIAHPNSSVFDRLTHIIAKVVEAHPRQALWSLIGIMTTRQVSERKARGTQILQTLRNISKKVEGSTTDFKHLLRMGEKLAEQLLLACQNGDFRGNKTVHASLGKDLRFNHKCTPCPLVVPVESSLTATLPAVSEYVKKHKAFSRDVVTIDSFLDDVLVLSSLAKPRRLTTRGSDGKSYMLLIKPKDDLRTDQRLMEFNGLINRSLKRDAESSRRQLYIRTYAVTPLNEECGIIEWVPGIKTMRDILISLYASRKIYPDYTVLKQFMDEACLSDGKTRIFTDEVLGRFPPVLQLWFTQQFPSPSTWFAARLKYTRSCAVMSMVGTILGLGDRHGENVNLEEGNGGVFHVDFNCLFDKGLTFAKPERVPFRLTHNMVAAMGIYGYEGPFRKSCELTLGILRQQEETLMTILEAFIYDPTLDLQKEKRAHRRGDVGVKLQPQSVVDSIKRKVRGLLPTESIPLGVEGQVEELIKQAVDPRNLAAMYIGWCPFL